MDAQERLNIYDEPPPCDESILLVKSPVPDLCEFDVPKFISLNRLIMKLTDPLTCNIKIKILNFSKYFPHKRVLVQLSKIHAAESIIKEASGTIRYSIS
jgi:hypothetical protein